MTSKFCENEYVVAYPNDSGILCLCTAMRSNGSCTTCMDLNIAEIESLNHHVLAFSSRLSKLSWDMDVSKWPNNTVRYCWCHSLIILWLQISNSSNWHNNVAISLLWSCSVENKVWLVSNTLHWNTELQDLHVGKLLYSVRAEDHWFLCSEYHQVWISLLCFWISKQAFLSPFSYFLLHT